MSSGAIRRPCTQGSPAKPGSALGYRLVRPMRGEEGVGGARGVTRIGASVAFARGFGAIKRPRTQGSPAKPGSALGYRLVRPMRGEEGVGGARGVTQIGVRLVRVR